jgi:hemolysin activation/secretion protein
MSNRSTKEKVSLNKGHLGAMAVMVGCALFGASSLAAQQGVTPQQSNVQGKAADESLKRLDSEDAETRNKQTGSSVIADELNRRELPPRGGATVLLKSVNIGPESAFLTQVELDPIISKYRGQRVDFSQISELVRDVNDLYAEKGIVTAAAILPPQNLNAGNLEIRLIEGQLGNVALVGEHLTKTGFILDRITLAKGTTVDVPTAAKDIELFNATSRAQLRLLVQPGAQFGYTDLLLGITEPQENEFQIFLDNNGVASTGEAQMSALVRRYGMLGIDDTLTLYGAVSEGSRSATARYELPVGQYGTRLAAGITASSVSVIAGPTKSLGIKGRSKSATLSLSHPLFTNENWTVQGTASAFVGDSTSAASGVPLVDTLTTKLSPGVTLAYRGDRGSFATQVQAVFAQSEDRLATATRDILVIAGSANGQYRFANGLALVGNASWQHSKDKLLPGSLLFQIGGPSSVRGYPSDGVAGDSGFYTSLELHKQFDVKGKGLDGYVFTDFGEVYSTFPVTTTLVSAGLGLNFDVNKNAKASLSIATPLKKSLTSQSEFVFSGMITLSAY